MKKFILLSICLISFGFLSAQEYLTIEMASKPVVADGIIDEKDPWGNNWIKQLKMTATSSTTDMYSEFQLMYDSINLYFAAKVFDATRNTGNPTTFLNDCVWIFIAMDTSSLNGEYKAGDRNLRLQAVADTNETGGTIESLQGAPEHGQYVCIDNGDNYVQEWIMPWAELYADMYSNWDGKQFKFDVGTTDATDYITRSQLMFWNDNSDLQWNNTTHFGQVTLSSEIPISDRTDQYIYFDSIPDIKYGIEDIILTAYSSSGLPITYNSSNSDVAAIINDKVIILGIGSTIITANQVGNTSFMPASPVSRVLTVISDTTDGINLFDFENARADTSWTIFGNGFYESAYDISVITNQDRSGINKSDGVLEFLVHPDANPWVGMWTDLNQPIQITETNHTFTMMVYKTIISPTGLKIESSLDGGTVNEIRVENTLINQWEMLSFDMSASIGYSYNRLVIFPDFPYSFRTDSTIVLLDNISFCKEKGLSVELVKSININCGDSINLNPVINYHGNGELSYFWSPQDGLNTTNVPDVVANTRNTRVYTLKVVSPDFGSVSKSVIVYINPVTAVIHEIKGTCGNTTQLNVTTYYFGSGEISYNWVPSSGLSASDIPDPFVLNLNSDSLYQVFVETSDGCSATDFVRLQSNGVSFYPSICKVTVDENNRNVIIINKDIENAIDSCLFYRESSNQTDQYDYIGILSYSEGGEFVDPESDARVQSHKYKIAFKDNCGYMTDYSNEHKTIHLAGLGTNGNLIWEPYGGLQIMSYKIYRGTSISDLIQIGSTSGSNNSYTDLTAESGDFFYQVEGIISDPCKALKSKGESGVLSNIFINTIINGINTSNIKPEFIYPNPAFDKLNIKAGNSTNISIMIFDMHGKLILSGIVKDEIDISKLSKGIYIVKLIDSGKILINKLIKE